MQMLERFRNADGSYDGVAFLAAISRLSRAEVAWTAARLQALIKAGTPVDQAKAAVRTEAVSQPWLHGQSLQPQPEPS